MARACFDYSKTLEEQIALVIPSRGRAHNVERMEALLPGASWAVPTDEVDAYRDAGAATVIGEPKAFSSMAAKRQWILSAFEAPVVFQCDDDLQHVLCLVGRKPRKVTEPEAIRAIIHQAAVCALDAGIVGFGFNRNPKPMQFKPHDFIGMTAPLCAAFGITEPGKKWFDHSLISREDVDMTLTMLLKRRIVWADNRFYFHFGDTWSGDGGLQLVRTKKRDEADVARVARKWGANVSLGGGNRNAQWATKKRGAMSIRVPRRIT